jgi:hypothetical protein
LPPVDADEPTPASGRGWAAAAVVGFALLVGSLGMAWVAGQPWRVVEAPSYRVHHLGETGFRVEVPELLGDPVRYDTQRQIDFVFGDALRDPVAVVVSVLPHRDGPLGADELAALQDDFFAGASEAPAHTTAVGSRVILEETPTPDFEERFVADNGLHVRLRYALHPGARVVTEILTWRGTPAVYQHAADRIAASVTPAF